MRRDDETTLCANVGETLDPRTPTPLQDGRRYAGRLNPQALPALPRKAVPGILSRLE